MAVQGFLAETDHIVLPHGSERMVLGGRLSGQAIVVAERADGVWTVSSPWTDDPDVTANTRAEAVQGMEDMALAISPDTGFTTWEPEVKTEHGVMPLRELP
jgi:hypothetical protein